MSGIHEKLAKEINRGASITFIGTLLKIVEFPLTLLAARLFGVGVWGQYIFLSTFIMPIIRFSTLGLDKGLVWFIAKHQDSRIGPQFFYFIQKILLCISAVLITGYGVHFWISRHSENSSALFEPVAFAMFIASIPFLVLTNMNLGISLGIKKPEHEALIRGIIYPLFYLAFPCFFSSVFQGIRAMAFFYLVGSFLGFASSLYFVRPIRAALAARTSEPEVADAFKILFTYSWPLGMRDVLLSLQSRADIWCLALFLPPKYIGIYGLASSLASSVKTVRQSFDNILLAVISQMKRTLDTDKIVAAYLYAAKMIMTVQAPVLAFLVFFAKPILALSGQDYILGENAVIIFAATLVFNGYLGLSAMIVIGLNKTKWALMNDLGALAMAVLLNILLVPIWGITGAALATSLSILIINLAWFIEAIYLLKRVPIQPSVIILFLASLLTLGLAFLFWKYFGSDTLLSRGIGYTLFLATYGTIVVIYLKKGILKIKSG